MTRRKRPRGRLVVMMAILTAVMVGLPALSGITGGPGLPRPRVAYAQSMPSKVKKAYVNKAKSLAKQVRSRTTNYKFVDVYGSSLQEMLCVTKDSSGSGSTLYIYTYANGKAKQLLKTGIYGDNWYKFYKKSNSFVLYRSGHGGEAYLYYRIKGGKYVSTVSKGRFMGASGSYGSWSYFDSVANRSITKTAYAKQAKKHAVGTAKKVSGSYKWAYLRV